MTRVLLWSPKGAGLHYGGPGMTAYRMYEASPPYGVELSLAHGFAEQAKYDLFREQHLVHPLGRPGALVPFLLRARSWLRANHQHADVFHGLQGFHATVMPALWAERLGLPAVVKLAAHKSDLAPQSGAKALLRLPESRQAMLKSISAVIALSQPIVDELLEYGFPEANVVQIPNAVRTDEFAPCGSQSERSALRTQLGLEDRPTVLFAGVINQRKRPHLLVEALSSLPADAQLVIVGPQEQEPAYAEFLKSRIADLGLSDRVMLHGFTSSMAPFYRAADVFALPSSKEGMPNALLEAMASGLPSVVTDFAGADDILRGTGAGLITPARPEELAEALSYFLNERTAAVAAGHAARNIVLDRYSVDSVLRMHLQLFDRVRSGATARE